MDDNKQMTRSQYGFNKGKSCLVNLVASCNVMTAWMHEGGAVDIFYLSFSKAFDIVSQNILTGKLKKFGLDEWTGGGLRTGRTADPRGL